MLNIAGFDLHGFNLCHCFFSYVTTEVCTCLSMFGARGQSALVSVSMYGRRTCPVAIRWKAKRNGNAVTPILDDQPKRNKSHFQMCWFGPVSDQPEYLAPVLYQKCIGEKRSSVSFLVFLL